MIWSHPPEPRKNTRPMWYVLAKPSIAIAFGLYTVPFGAPLPFLNASAVYGPWTFRSGAQ